MDARIFATEAEARECAAAVDKALGYPRGYTQADVDSGLVQRGPRCAPLSSIRTERHADVCRHPAGDAWGYPWDEVVAKLAGRDIATSDGTVRIPSAANGTIDDSWAAAPAAKETA